MWQRPGSQVRSHVGPEGHVIVVERDAQFISCPLSNRVRSGQVDLVDLTRGGWSNTAGVQRSTLQRVSYQLVNGVVQRSYLPVLDPVSATQPVVLDLLHDVTSLKISYLDQNQNWNPQWPPPSLAPPQSLWTRPVAVEILVEFKDWGKVRRLVEVAG